ncbi:hypothetical protein MKW98_031660 [Papaver atlanticum]|uniref:Ubiquitin-like protease family profile domain-containing protein n=1 Tax=Papaver atlanticum TaxID=357466 RepID=A0AAD4X9T1_9MAGN|nr:hypothetical protein MKW98_031660 [Papaver atlanticum]
MGALTINSRKRGNDYLNLNSVVNSFQSPSSVIDFQVLKKPRFSPMQITSSETSLVVVETKTNIASRVHRYPEPSKRLGRTVHAPVRKPRVSSSLNLGRDTGSGEMGNFWSRDFLSRQLEEAKRNVWGSGKKEREVDIVKDDLRIDEVEVIEDGVVEAVDGRSVISEKKQPIETSGDKFLLEKYEEFANNLAGSSSMVSDVSNQEPKVDETGKMLETLFVDRDLEYLGVPVHKTLYKSAEKRNVKLEYLKFQIGFENKKLSSFPRPSKKSEEDVVEGLFTPLTDEEEREVDAAFSSLKRRKVLVAHENSNIEITGELLRCLTPGGWLNDEVINVYLELLKERERREPKKFLKCHFFNTFFYKKLASGRTGYDYKAVKRWTTQRKIGYGLIECDKIFVPIHQQIHWCLAVINKKEEKLQYLDSLKGVDNDVLENLARYFVDEVKDKSGKDIDVSSWKREYVKNLPEQQNGWDCGMFMIKYSDFYSRGLGLCFSQEHMPYFRRRTANEILRLKAD